LKLHTFDRCFIVSSKITRKGKTTVPVLSSFQRLFDRDCLDELLLLKETAYDCNEKTRELVLFALVAELLSFSHAHRSGKGLHVIKQGQKGTPDVKDVLKKKLEGMQMEHREFYRGIHAANCVMPLQGDARNFQTLTEPVSGEKKQLPPRSIDAVLTSPPYCNSSDYIEMYKLEHWFLDFVKSYEDFRDLSESTIRSHTSFTDSSVKWNHEVVEDICSNLDNLWNKGQEIPDMIRGYFDDLYTSLSEIKKFLRPGGVVLMVVANSCYGEIPLPTDLLLCQAGSSLGFQVKGITTLRKTMTSGQQWKNLGSEEKKLLRESLLTLKAAS